MTWVKRLKRVFNINIETCGVCGGAVKVIASIEAPVATAAFGLVAAASVRKMILISYTAHIPIGCEIGNKQLPGNKQ